MKKRWLAAILVVMLLLVQAVAMAGGENDHEHVWSGEWRTDAVDHWHYCTVEGCDEVEKYISHNMVENTENDGYVCDECGYTSDHLHVWDKWAYDDELHWKKCSVEGCEEENLYAAEHTFVDDGNGGVICEECGYTRNHKEHVWSTDYDWDREWHWQYCTIEGCNVTGEEDRHDLVKDETNGLYICTVCDAQFAHLGEHQWSEDWMYDDTRHWHNCTIEGCKVRYIPYTGEQTDHYTGEHTFVDDGNGGVICEECGYTRNHKEHVWSAYDCNGEWHWRYCTIEGCSATDEAEHTFVDGKCECGYEKPHEHNWKTEWKYDETNHWHECEGCDAKDEEAHTLVNGKCACGYEKKQEEKPAEPSYDYDNEYVALAPLPPQTGDASYLAIGIGMIAAAVCIALRKRQSN